MQQSKWHWIHESGHGMLSQSLMSGAESRSESRSDGEIDHKLVL